MDRDAQSSCDINLGLTFPRDWSTMANGQTPRTAPYHNRTSQAFWTRSHKSALVARQHCDH